MVIKNMILRQLKQGTILISFSGILFTVEHKKYGRKYIHSTIKHNYTKISYIRNEIRHFEIYDQNNKQHAQRAEKWLKEHKEYLKKICKNEN